MPCGDAGIVSAIEIGTDLDAGKYHWVLLLLNRSLRPAGIEVTRDGFSAALTTQLCYTDSVIKLPV